MKIYIPEKIKKAFLPETHTYVVGGCIRDMIMGVKSNDIDLATSLIPDEIKSICNKNNIYCFDKGGEKFGVLVMSVEGNHYEITSFKKELGDRFLIELGASLEDEISRRDFTMNALVYNFHTDEIIDKVDGISDIKNRILRAVGNPINRFEEDGVRILRALRFKNQFNLRYDKFLFSTLRMKKFLTNRLAEVSIERIRMELMKSLKKANVSWFFTDLLELGLLETVFPPLVGCVGKEQNGYHTQDVFAHSVYTARKLQEIGANELLILTGLLHDTGKPDVREWIEKKKRYMFIGHELYSVAHTNSFMEKFKFSKKDIRYVTTMIKHHMKLGSNISRASVLYIQYELEEKGLDIRDLYTLYVCDSSRPTHARIDMKKYVFDELKPMPINGHDFLPFIKQPINLGELLDKLRKYFYRQNQTPDKEDMVKVGMNMMANKKWIIKPITKENT